MKFWHYLMPSYRRAQEREMNEELESLAALAHPGELGNLTCAAEDARTAWTWTWLEQFGGDVRYAMRTMRHNPGFTATAVFSLALGIGANTAIFSLIDALMLRWLPVRDPQELVLVKMRGAHAVVAGETFSYAIVKALSEQSDLFSHVGGFSSATFTVGPRGSVNQVRGAWVTGDCYQTLGLNPAMGRLLTTEDDKPEAPLVAVISYGYWERKFAGGTEAIGQSLTVNGVPVVIVGVSPAGFTGANVGAIADITIPVAALPQVDPPSAGLLGQGNFWLRILARPRTGVSMAQAEARLTTIWPQMADRVISPRWSASQRAEASKSTFELSPGGTGYTYLRDIFRKPLMVLMWLVGLVLLIACANVANLLLARATARQREISVRLAIGAGRARIIRQLLTESTLLSLVGAALGICLAWLTSRFLLDILSGGSGGRYPVVFDLTPNWHVLAFTTAVAIATGIFFGLAPAFQITATGRAESLKSDTRMTSSRSRLLSTLVSVQVALSLMLLVGAGLFVRTLQNLQNLDPGFRREGVLLVELDGRREGYRDARLAAFYQDLFDRVKRVPGAVSASISSHTPMSGSSWSEAAVPKGKPLPERDNAQFIAAGPDYFRTMDTPLVAGREFDARDQGSANVAIVNQAFAARHFPGRSPIGEYISATTAKPPQDLQIVGVVKDVNTKGLRRAPAPTVYVAFFQRAPGDATIEVRATGSISQVASAIRGELQPSFPSAPLQVGTLTSQVEQTLVQERLLANLAGGFGVLGLVLASVGLYGLLAYSVARRTKEIGIRMALGAQQDGVLWMVSRGALGLVMLGVGLGLPAAWMATRWVQSMLFGMKATDPGIIAFAVGVLTVASLVAAYLPARRAARVNPLTALRHE